MSGPARVENLEVIKEFRIRLDKFRDTLMQALGDADADINKTQNWLEGAALSYWNLQLRKRQEAVTRAEEQLRHKKLFKDASGRIPTAVDEQKAVLIAKKNLAEAQQKLANIKKWTRTIEKETTLYRGGVARFSDDIASGVPMAMAQLGKIIEQLEKYMGLGPVPLGTEPGEGELVGAGAIDSGIGGMARGVTAGGGAEVEMDDRMKPENLRAMQPSADLLAKAPKLPRGRFTLECAPITTDQQEILSRIITAPMETPDDQRIAVAVEAVGAKRLFILRLDPPAEGGAGFCIVPVDELVANGYDLSLAAEARHFRPDLAAVLRMPPGWMAVIDETGLLAVYDKEDEPVWTSKPQQ